MAGLANPCKASTGVKTPNTSSTTIDAARAISIVNFPVKTVTKKLATTMSVMTASVAIWTKLPITEKLV